MKKFLALTAFMLASFSALQAQVAFSVGDTAPDFNVVDEHNQPHSLYQYTDAGQYVVLDFFAYWCVPCYNTAPIIDAFYKKYGCNNYDVVVLGLEYSGNNTQLATFNSNANLPPDAYPAASGITGMAQAVGTAYGVQAFPTIVLIGPDRKFINIDIWPLSNIGHLEAAFPANVLTEQSCVTGLSEAAPEVRLSAYPNPATSHFFVSAGSSLLNKNYTISNRLGQTVATGVLTAEVTKIGCENLASGMYFLTVDGAGGKAVKLVKE